MLNEDLWRCVLSHLSIKNVSKLESVSKKFQRTVRSIWTHHLLCCLDKSPEPLLARQAALFREQFLSPLEKYPVKPHLVMPLYQGYYQQDSMPLIKTWCGNEYVMPASDGLHVKRYRFLLPKVARTGQMDLYRKLVEPNRFYEPDGYHHLFQNDETILSLVKESILAGDLAAVAIWMKYTGFYGKETPLRTALLAGDTRMVDFILASEDRHRWNGCFFEFSRLETAKILLFMGYGFPEGVCHDWEDFASSVIKWVPKEELLEMIDLGLPVDSGKDDLGEDAVGTVLYLNSDDVSLMKGLLERGADPNIPCPGRGTILDFLIEEEFYNPSEFKEHIRLVVSYGANLNTHRIREIYRKASPEDIAFYLELGGRPLDEPDDPDIEIPSDKTRDNYVTPALPHIPRRF